jgi:hypothetical protein
VREAPGHGRAEEEDTPVPIGLRSSEHCLLWSSSQIILAFIHAEPVSQGDARPTPVTGGECVLHRIAAQQT